MVDRFDSDGLKIVAFAPSDLQLHVMPLGTRPDWVKPIRASEAIEHTGAEAVLDGPMYRDCPGECRDIRFLHFQRGSIDIRSDEPTVGITAAVFPDGSTSWTRGGNLPEGASVAVQLFPSLVENGRSVAENSPNTESSWRAALGELEDGRLAFVIWRGSVPEFARKLARAGFRWAGYTDGGGSTSMQVGDTRLGATDNRAVGSFLLAKSASSTTRIWIIVLGTIAGLGLVALVGWLVYRQVQKKGQMTRRE